MLERIVSAKFGVTWIDVNAPTEAELRTLAEQHGLPETVVHDCLDSPHQPKYERLGEQVEFLIIRHFDADSVAKTDADTVQELTRKTAVFSGPGFLITVHRKLPPFLESLKEKFRADKKNPREIVMEIVRCSLVSFEVPLDGGQDAVDSFELHIFNNLANASVLEAMYFLKRKLSVYRRMIRQSLDVLARLATEGYSKATLNSARERGERLFASADDQVEEIRNLLNTHISLASHRTNEIMRVLTVFSAFFLPLSFIVGVYGMNFQHMPELQWKAGYAFVWVVLAGTATTIAVWFRRKGWFR